MTVDLGLQVAANAFIEALTPLVAAVTGDDGARRRVVDEAWELSLAFIDADRRATDAELWALIVAFAPVRDPDLLEETPASLRAAGLTDGRRRRLADPLPLFDSLLAADRDRGTDWASTYYQHAVALGFMVASLDDLTARDELLAIESFRGRLLDAIRAGARPPAGDGGRADARRGTDHAADREPDRDAGPDHAEGAVEPGRDAPGTAPDEPDEPPRPIDDLLAELQGLVGLGAVKEEVTLLTNLLRVRRLRAERGLGGDEDRSNHLVFTGNPGTGKTTVARLLAEIYRSLGVVPRGQLVETDRAGLVAGFVGQTATKVVAAFDRADGGVLLIDEAYALARGGENDFGREAIDTIVKLVEDRRDRLVVIVAGYPDEMKEFIDTNPGLSSRFPRTIHFPDYTTDELLAIFRSLCDRGRYLLDADAERAVRTWLDAQPRTKGFGNGRLVRNLFEDAVARQATRVVAIDRPSDVDLVLLLPVDIPAAVPANTEHGAGDVGAVTPPGSVA